MTTKEAINRIEDHIEVHKIGQYPHVLIKDALDMAIAALLAQQTPAKLDRSRWEGCKYCNKYGLVVAAFDGWNYCNRCGKPLTEAAWAELERRIGGNDGKTDNGEGQRNE